MSIFNKKNEVSNNNLESVNYKELQVFVIYDQVAKVYGLPVFYENVQVAVRNFKSLINKEGNIYNEHSSDFDLVHIGVYNKDTTAFRCIEPVVVVNGFNLKD